MKIFGFGAAPEGILGIDIGYSGIKLVELDPNAKRPTLKTLAFAPLDADVFSGYLIKQPARVGEEISKLLDTHHISVRRAAVALPASSVFTKRIKVPRGRRDELQASIHLEAANVIPHKMDAVKFDYQILGEAPRNQLEVLVVAAKSEIVDSFIEAILAADVDTVVVDVDTFALQNAFESAIAGDLKGKPVALLNVGARYTAVIISEDGHLLFSGDIPSGGKGVSEALAAELSIAVQEAEELKRSPAAESGVREATERQLDRLTSDLNRQLALFWSASGAQQQISKIYISGGVASESALLSKLSEKTGVACVAFDPLRGIDCSQLPDSTICQRLSPLCAIAIGLASRRPGDKLFPAGV